MEEVQASFAVASMLKQVGSTCGDRFGGTLRARPFFCNVRSTLGLRVGTDQPSTDNR